MKPKFKVGEEVILQSVTHPNLNGGARIISDPVHNTDKCKCPYCGKQFKGVSGHVGYAYYLDIVSSAGCCVLWDESALRKKHKPSDKSFDELINEINRTVKQ